ncbi:MAG: hypothetical protein E6H90_12425 [Chloroflexi bacterium]|nr:MAG: hypothetical protein E6I31_12305 [Chloroflexota bacterium]TMG43164.1 MAG: hypothetical protein E6H90_12425 [Chloroflexota bacterium]
MARLGLVLREGLVFGLIAGAFALVIRLVALLATGTAMPNPFSSFVTTALTLLIIGGAGRKLAAATGTTTPSLQMGALAGGISELMRNLVAAIIISYLPAGQSAFAHLTPAARRAATDTSTLAVALGQQLGLAIVVGAMIGWLGAWALLRFQPPREPPVK